MEVFGQLHVPTALPPWKEPPVPIEQEAGLALKYLFITTFDITRTGI
jgi:hypothetical protein